MKDMDLKKLIRVSLLGVIGFLLMFLEFATPFFPPFLKFDISDLPALIGAFAMGPVAGVIIELLKNILHGIFGSGSAFVGELANFSVGSVFALTAGYVYKKENTNRSAVKALVVGTIAMTISASVLNLYVFLPLYETVLHFPMKAIVGMGNKLNSSITDVNTFIIFSIMPFTMIKGIIVSMLTTVVYRAVAPALGVNSVDFNYKI